MNKDIKDMNYDRAKVFCKEGIKVHISKGNGTFFNGTIEDVRVDFFFIVDEVNGRQLVFFRELNRPIVEFKEVEDGKKV